jgi:glycosyltransferase involved in cell wall biosynthesis
MPAKVAVICLCYNHAQFVKEAMESVLAQTYPCELIVIDDASTDDSEALIKKVKNSYPANDIKTIFLKDNIGNCKAFNRGLEMTDADYIIDLAADDRLLLERVERGVKSLEEDKGIAVNFTNANYIDEKGSFTNTHYRVEEFGKAIKKPPQGNIFHEILGHYFICSPTMMYRASFLKEIGGYDEELAYEDFDIQLRLSRNHPFSYTDRVLVEKRVLQGSLGSIQYKKGNKQLASTLRICKKVFSMIHDKREKRALLKRIAYEARQAFIYKRFDLFSAFLNLGFKIILRK